MAETDAFVVSSVDFFIVCPIRLRGLSPEIDSATTISLRTYSDEDGFIKNSSKFTIFGV